MPQLKMHRISIQVDVEVVSSWSRGRALDVVAGRILAALAEKPSEQTEHGLSVVTQWKPSLGSARIEEH